MNLTGNFLKHPAEVKINADAYYMLYTEDYWKVYSSYTKNLHFLWDDI